MNIAKIKTGKHRKHRKGKDQQDITECAKCAECQTHKQLLTCESNTSIFPSSRCGAGHTFHHTVSPATQF